MSKKMPWFPMFPKDYMGDTLGLSCCEHGCYLMLLMQSWTNGPLTPDLDRLQRIAGNPPMETLRFILETYWHRIDTGWVNAKLEEIREKQAEAHDRRVSAGRKGGQQKSSNAKAMLKQCSSNPEPRTQNPEYITHISREEVANATSENSARVSTRNPVPFAKIVELWGEVLPELPQPVKLTDARKAQIRARWQDELPDLDAWRECFTHIKASPFLMGKVDPSPERKRFRCSLDWITKQANLLKLYEGRYDA